ncbi:hypothetical protein PPMP20_18640 [Paraburkholderia phymatum]|uniref:hypothetical protein n=1 Tax=Paraburkholderia phymatum TaxID=148447 RepID=UPI00031F2058|nr:hypothetical protein [Paraburkholderia phymatum]
MGSLHNLSRSGTSSRACGQRNSPRTSSRYPHAAFNTLHTLIVTLSEATIGSTSRMGN